MGDTFDNLFSVIQLLATVSIGFVFFSYSEYFAKTLKTSFFLADRKLEDSRKNCIGSFPDQATRDCLHEIPVGRGSTRSWIEELKRDCEKLQKDIDNKWGSEKELEKGSFWERLDKIGKMKGIISTIFFVFFISVTILFYPAAHSVLKEQTLIFVFVLTFLSLIYLIVGWLTAESWRPHCVFFRYGSIRHPIIWFVLISVISALCAIFLKGTTIGNNLSTEAWKYTSVSFIVCGWFNFFIYAFKIRREVIKFLEDVEKTEKELVDRGKKLDDKYQHLVAVESMANGETSDISSQSIYRTSCDDTTVCYMSRDISEDISNSSEKTENTLPAAPEDGTPTTIDPPPNTT